MNPEGKILSIPTKEKVITELVKAGGVAVILGALNWFLWQQNLTYQQRNEERILQLEKDVRECNSSTVQLLQGQIQKNNVLLDQITKKLDE